MPWVIVLDKNSLHCWFLLNEKLVAPRLIPRFARAGHMCYNQSEVSSIVRYYQKGNEFLLFSTVLRIQQMLLALELLVRFKWVFQQIKCTSPNEHFNQIENWKCQIFDFRLISVDHIKDSKSVCLGLTLLWQQYLWQFCVWAMFFDGKCFINKQCPLINSVYITCFTMFFYSRVRNLGQQW